MGRETTHLDRETGQPVPATGADRTPEFTPLLRVGYVRNPRSHRNKDHVEADGAPAHVTMAEPATRQELEDALAGFAREGIDVLAISGGDGTVRDVLTRGAPLFGDAWPALVVLPRGKTNALALDLALPKDWSLSRALEAFRHGRLARRRPLLVAPSAGDTRDRYGFIFGAGIFNVAIDAGQVVHRHGAFQSLAVGMTAAIGIAQALFGLGEGPWRRLTRMRIADEAGKNLAHSGRGRADSRLLAGFTTLTTFPLGLRPFTGTGHEGPIHYFLLDAPVRRAIALIPAAAMGWRGRILSRLGLHRGSGREFALELEGDFILDGERFPPGTCRIRTGPELTFIVP